MLTFKPATHNDFNIWSRFRDELYGDLKPDYIEAEIKRIIEDPDLASFIIYDKKNKTPVGMVEMSLRNIVDGCVSSPVAYIDGLYLIEEYRGKGFGKALISFTKKWAKENNCTELAVDTELDNKRAQKFYLREGFGETFRIVQFKMTL
ncbi:MAG: GNAT family N-acetyltransferase [Bacteroidota bacterium]